MKTRVTLHLDVDVRDVNGRRLIAPLGIMTPHQLCEGFIDDGLDYEVVQEAETGQAIAVIEPAALEGRSEISLGYRFVEPGSAYPDAVFRPRSNCYTQAADALIADMEALCSGVHDTQAKIDRIVQHTAERFVYGHVDVRFNDGMDAVPSLGCGTARGSCVDINTYLIAGLRSVGVEAGYLAGYFFPEEKAGRTSDMHCWVATRDEKGETLEWDIAHHLKLGTRTIRPGLNPKPGDRVAVSHSMGWDVPGLNIQSLKLLADPAWVDASGAVQPAELRIARTRQSDAEKMSA